MVVAQVVVLAVAVAAIVAGARSSVPGSVVTGVVLLVLDAWASAAT